MEQISQCSCCGFRTGCRTCPVCYWTNDDAPAAPPADGSNGDLSLGEARLNFALYGASRRRYVELVRAPRADERP